MMDTRLGNRWTPFFMFVCVPAAVLGGMLVFASWNRHRLAEKEEAIRRRFPENLRGTGSPWESIDLREEKGHTWATAVLTRNGTRYRYQALVWLLEPDGRWRFVLAYPDR